MEKEPVTKFDLEAAFKALDELPTPTAEKGIAANRVNLDETFANAKRNKLKTELLIEDYYDLNSTQDLEQAKSDREEEVAQAKLARIEKIVDLDAASPEDLLPSYVGKVIIQCPQCMTLFYKNPEDIETSEDDDTIVNVNEVCQHCGNASGYTVIGKVGALDQEEQPEETPTEEPAEENELNLDFEEAPTEEQAEEEREELTDEESDLSLEPVEDEAADEEEEQPAPEEKEKADEEKKAEEEEEEKKEESLNASEAEKAAEKTSELATDNESENKSLNEEENACKASDAEKEDLKEEANKDSDIDNKLKAHNDYIAYLQQMIEQEEEALGKTDNEEVKAAIQRRLDALSKDLGDALPEAVKDELTVEELPTPEEAAEKEAPTDESVHKSENAAKAAEGELPDAKTLHEDVVTVTIDAAPGREPVVSTCVAPSGDPKLGVEPAAEPAAEPAPAEEPAAEPVEAPAAEAECEGPECEAQPACADGECEAAPVIEPIAPTPTETPIEEPAETPAEEPTEEPAEEQAVEPTCEGGECEEVPPAEIAVAVAEGEPIEIGHAFDDVEELDEESVAKCIAESLTTVYENVEGFKLTECSIANNALTLAGDITFKSGKTRPVKYVFSECVNADGKLALTGKNESLSDNGSFKLTLKRDGANACAESIAYKYFVGEKLIEGIAA